jgi:DNA-binding PucR family transcriptional regulator
MGFSTSWLGGGSIHPNTVVYRLRRIRELTGRDPHDPDDLLLTLG